MNVHDFARKHLGQYKVYVMKEVGKLRKVVGNEYTIFEEYAIGVTSGGVEYLVSTSELEKVKEYTWGFDGQYITTHDWKNNYKKIRIHRLITNPLKNLDVDHVNHNKLDNRTENLRICEPWQNCANRSKQHKKNKHGCTGVVFKNSEGGHYEAYIRANKKTIYLGRTRLLAEAVKLRKDAEIQYFGEFTPARKVVAL
jgi:hypothetical protein